MADAIAKAADVPAPTVRRSLMLAETWEPSPRRR